MPTMPELPELSEYASPANKDWVSRYLDLQNRVTWARLNNEEWEKNNAR
jgi:hypothetical protein